MRGIKITKKRFSRLSNIFDNAGQVIFGGTVLSPIWGGIDNSKTFLVVLGMITMIICWIMSFLLAQRKDNYDF